MKSYRLEHSASSITVVTPACIVACPNQFGRRGCNCNSTPWDEKVSCSYAKYKDRTPCPLNWPKFCLHCLEKIAVAKKFKLINHFERDEKAYFCKVIIYNVLIGGA